MSEPAAGGGRGPNDADGRPTLSGGRITARPVHLHTRIGCGVVEVGR
jgi:hypothetical protein